MKCWHCTQKVFVFLSWFGVETRANSVEDAKSSAISTEGHHHHHHHHHGKHPSDRKIADICEDFPPDFPPPDTNTTSYQPFALIETDVVLSQQFNQLLILLRVIAKQGP
ncbi:hypothetical protein NC652_015620 [Populus alba x Populus x berolinensis]|nr:hypothetical protein NC652_015620 [Populus alba x Populus x berolinensis]